MRRVVSIWLKDWPVTVWARTPESSNLCRSLTADVPFALVERTGRGLVLAGLNEAARRLGLRHGQAHADACAIAPELLSAPAEPEKAAAALRRLALWAERWSPAVAVDAGRPELEGLFLDVTGAAHLWGGEPQLLADIRGRLQTAGVEARVALAGTPGAAWALARYTAHADPIAPEGQERAALAALPIEGLRLSDKAAALLHRFGLRRIGDLYPLPRSGLARRFRGAEGLEVVGQLDRALGLAAEALACEQRPAAYRAHQVFAEPVTVVEAAQLRAEPLVADLCRTLERDGQGARRVVVTGFRVDGRTTALEAALGTPSRDAKHILRLLREKGWERLDLGFGVDALMVWAAVVEPLSPAQVDSESRTRAADAAARAALMDRLVARLGEAAVGRPVLRDSWIPERSEALTLLPCERQRTGEVAPGFEPGAGGGADRHAPSAALGGPPPPFADAHGRGEERPLLLLDRPEPIEATAELPEGAPARFVWRRVPRRVRRSTGPERLSPEWWRPPNSGPFGRDGRAERTRDYYKLEDEEGGRYWVFREGLYGREDADRAPTWWMHGVFP